jgi:putative holliday junction resolvase
MSVPVAAPTRILAIDYGEKRIGLALSDELCLIASGLPTIENTSRLVESLVVLCRDRGVARIVVGLPLTLKGEVGSSAAAALAFVERLRAATEIPVEMTDERFTSSLAEDAMRQGGMKRSRRREKGLVDEIAAVILLQDFLQSRAFTTRI